jgi:hypothetical protein
MGNSPIAFALIIFLISTYRRSITLSQCFFSFQIFEFKMVVKSFLKTIPKNLSKKSQNRENHSLILAVSQKPSTPFYTKSAVRTVLWALKFCKCFDYILPQSIIFAPKNLNYFWLYCLNGSWGAIWRQAAVMPSNQREILLTSHI